MNVTNPYSYVSRERLEALDSRCAELEALLHEERDEHQAERLRLLDRIRVLEARADQERRP